MKRHRLGASFPSSPWITAVLWYSMVFTTLFQFAGALSSNASILSAPTSIGNFSTGSRLTSFATEVTSLSSPWLSSNDNDNIVIDPDCDPKLVLRQLADSDEKPDCPCCVSGNGTGLLPFVTPDHITRTALPTTSFNGPHSLWEATATIHGEPVPTGDSELSALSICVACADGLCSLANSKGRRQVDDGDSDTDPWPESDDEDDEDDFAFEEDEDEDRSTATDILTRSLTHPSTWAHGEESWWLHMYNLVINRGARFGPRLQRGRIDPRLENYQFLSHSSMINFQAQDSRGQLVQVEEGLAGGIIPIWGCTGIVIVSDRGVYTAHIWEAPTFIPGPGMPSYDAATRRMYWDFGVKQFFARGNQNIVNPPSHALADLVRRGGPFARGSYSWIQVHIFGVAHHARPGPMYPEQMQDLEDELRRYLGHVDDREFHRHIYTRRTPPSEGATFLNSNEFFRDRAGLQLVAWQYAPAEESPRLGSSGTQRTRAFRLWWNKRVMVAKTWCDRGVRDCEVPCGRDMPERDSDRQTYIGRGGYPGAGSGTASGSGSRPRRDLTAIEPSITDSSLVRRQDRSAPGLPKEFTEMFPSELTDPRTWGYGSLDWWRRMYTVAVRYSATGDSSALLNVVSGDDYSADHCVYRDLDNTGQRGIGGGVTPLYGCTGLVVASNKGVYSAHFWEQPNFFPPPPQRQSRKPDLYGDERKMWNRRVTGTLRNGWKPYFDDQPWGPSLEDLRPEVFSGPGVEWLKVWVMHPDQSMQEITGEARYPTKIGWLLDDLDQILGVREDDVELVTYVKSGAEAVAIVGNDRLYSNNPGIHMFLWQFAPDAPAREPGVGFQYVNALRVFWDRREVFYHEWCPALKDCSSPVQAYCERRAEAGPSKRDAVAIRQGSQIQTTPVHTATAAPTNGAELTDKVFVFPDKLTTPANSGAGEDNWWKQMQDTVSTRGAGMYDAYTPPDDFVSDHAVFRAFGDEGFGTGIEPMWGCTGIVVMSDKGIYTARVWEVPTFVVPYNPENPTKWSYAEDNVWEGRLMTLLYAGYEAASSDAEDIPALSGLANGTSAFSPDARDWIHVQIITPITHGNSSETRPLYFQKIAKLRKELVSILNVEKEDVKIKTYSPRKDPEIHGTNGTAAEMEAYLDSNIGVNMLAVQYAPAQRLRTGTPDETSLRAIRMWWDRSAYFTHFWCPPNTTAVLPSDATSGAELLCAKLGSDIEPLKSSAGEVCQVTLSPTLYPSDGMRVQLGVSFSRISLRDGERDLSDMKQVSSHNFTLSLGGLVSVPSSDSGLPLDFTAKVSRGWDQYLWDQGYTCKCDDSSCDTFSRSCCSDDSCADYACNCKDADDHGDLCWPDPQHIASCCRTKQGCLDKSLRRGPESEKEPNLQWEYFEHGFGYGDETWSSGRVEDVNEEEFPPARPFCQGQLKDALGYNDISKFGKKDFSWHRAVICYFACGNPDASDSNGSKGSGNTALPYLPSVPLADDEPGMYADLEEPLYNPGLNMSEGGIWTTGSGPVPTGVF